jgi:hypothetical protein
MCVCVCVCVCELTRSARLRNMRTGALYRSRSLIPSMPFSTIKTWAAQRQRGLCINCWHQEEIYTLHAFQHNQDLSSTEATWFVHKLLASRNLRCYKVVWRDHLEGRATWRELSIENSLDGIDCLTWELLHSGLYCGWLPCFTLSFYPHPFLQSLFTLAQTGLSSKHKHLHRLRKKATKLRNCNVP